MNVKTFDNDYAYFMIYYIQPNESNNGYFAFNLSSLEQNNSNANSNYWGNFRAYSNNYRLEIGAQSCVLTKLNRFSTDYDPWNVGIWPPQKGIGYPFDTVAERNYDSDALRHVYFCRAKYINRTFSWFSFSGKSTKSDNTIIQESSSSYQLNNSGYIYHWLAF